MASVFNIIGLLHGAERAYAGHHFRTPVNVTAKLY